MSANAEPAERKNSYSAPALEKGFDVIELLATANAGLTITDIASRLGRSISEVFRIIVVMERRGYLHKNRESDRYTVTYKILDLAYRATPAEHLTRIAAPVMFDLVHSAMQSCHLVVPNGRTGLVVAREENPGQTSFSVRLGAQIDLLNSCSGHVILAFTDEERLAPMLGAGKAGALLQPLEPTLAAIRARGFEARKSPMTAGVQDISYPVFGFDRRVAAALTIPFLERVDGSHPVDIDTATLLLQRAAREISSGLGWYPPDEDAPEQDEPREGTHSS